MILVGFILFNSLRTIFGSCNKLTTGLTLDYIKFFLYYWGSIKYRYNDRTFHFMTYDSS